ncbi:MAG TPA: hypothetical protein VFE14_20840 [Micromonosporaceae bacterium]|jgi:hypothetical protein|nr:hypothetical protein [Micromonosporaceae bacterium]
MWRRLTRYFTPTGFVLAALCFLLPFATVSCDAPGGYGRSAPGGTTTYTGVDLVVGGAPTVDPKHLRPVGERWDDRLNPQILAIVTLVLILAGIATVALRQARVRRAVAAGLAAAAAIFLLANQATTEALLVARLESQLSVPMPAGKGAGDYVKTGNGFGFALIILIAVLLGNLIAWLVGRSRPAVTPGPSTDLVIAPEPGAVQSPWHPTQ